MRWPFARKATALALRRDRPEAAARLVGYAKQSFEARGMGAETLEAQLQDAADLIEAVVGAERMQVLTQEGRALTDAEALALACGA